MRLLHHALATTCHTLLCLFFLGIAFAKVAYGGDIQALQSKALEDKLHDSRYWHALLHYYPVSRAQGKKITESHVDDPRFFLSTSGKTDPESELLASIETLLGDDTSGKATDARCRFVARQHWLRSQLDLPELEIPAHCDGYHTFRSNVGRGSVTLVFPASYLNSPSSMFGHTLLRFDQEDMSNDSPLLSWSLNFAADVGNESMSATFAIKGIAGGFPGRFNSIPYFEKLKEYGSIENRDIWEYKLDLTPDEIDRMLDHAWELQDISFDYFFFRQNCSFRLLELIDVGRSGLNLSDQFPYTAIPADTVKAVHRAGIVSDVVYRASQGTRLNHAIDAIPANQRHWISKVQESPSATQQPEFQVLAAPLQSSIIRSASDLLMFNSRRQARAQQTARTRLELLTLISQLDDNTPLQIPEPPPPDAGHETTLVAVTAGRSTSTNFTELALRFSYHDILDRNTGYARGAGIELGHIRIRQAENDDARLEAFDVIRLQSFSDRHAAINGLSWELTAGLARQAVIDDDRLAARFDGNVGKSMRLGSHNTAYAFIGTSAFQYVDPGDSFLNAHIRLGAIGYQRFGATQLELRLDSIQTTSLHTALSFSHNLPLSKNHALRLSATANKFRDTSSEDYSLSYRFYF